MEENQIKDVPCSLEEHKDKNSIMECEYCDFKLCNECSKFHLKFLPKHNLIKINDTQYFNFKSTCS